ncbi:hypothetical protein [Frigoriglobus tundricola]|uniref:Secretin/TonB short N-terminal domain-containing protein n=1 Tax=Frigoriglobus tundricola TaxID=2774151 RepID=A0A6M5YUH8_9BACT|nr:hypothetical protein [Frigoriglobus tundricola]QJW96953.1 hypothetical protein FTUN_4513 [Frigoriglobus tundricola]
MSRSACLVALCGLVLAAAPVRADEPKSAAKTGESVERILDALGQEFVLQEGANINDYPLAELLLDLNKRYAVPFVINEESFKAAGRLDLKAEKPRFAATDLKGMTVRQVLNTVLDGFGAVYLIKNGAVEIVTVEHAAKVTKAPVSTSEAGGLVRLDEPLVSAVFKERPLHEVVARLADTYDLTVLVSPQAGDARAGLVSARVLNVPADKALELLADQADLRVVRRGTTFLVTSKDHANALLEERVTRDRQRIELEKLRAAPPAPVPVPKP